MAANLSHHRRNAIQYLRAAPADWYQAIGRARPARALKDWAKKIWAKKIWAVTVWGLTINLATSTAWAGDRLEASGELQARAARLDAWDSADYSEPWQKESYSNQAQNNREDYKYLGNMVSLKFHCPGCPYGQIMARPKRIFFQYRYQAIEQGFKPCRFCLPPVWKTVRARLINPDISR